MASKRRWALGIALGILVLPALYVAGLWLANGARPIPNARSLFTAYLVILGTTVFILVAGLFVAFVQRVAGFGFTMPWLRFRDVIRKALEP